VRVNSDLGAAMAGLREHHARSWVGGALERVWGRMAGKGRLVVMELWLIETG
jgi:hypothetical protein